MDAQGISIATAVVSAAVAALGLLLTSYRREGRKEDPRSRWLYIAAGAGIATLAAIGVTATFMLGTNGETSAAAPMQLTEAQYKGQVSAACLDSREKSRRLDELQALKTLLGATIKVEQDEANQIKQQHPPDQLKSIHDEIVFVLERRVRLMESTYQHLSQLSDKDLEAELAAVDRLAEQHEKLVRSLGLPECVIG